jgi:ribosomal protein S27E
MKVNCLGCGHNVDVDESYGDYEGRVKCFGCGAILEIKTEGGMLQSVSVNKATLPSPVEEVVEHAS